MNNPAIDYQKRTECAHDTIIYTDEFDDGIWLSVMVTGGSARAILTKPQALELIENINFALSANKGQE